jgi:hypothetical protein
MKTSFEGNKIINNILIFLIERKMKMENKKKYSQPSMTTVAMESELMTIGGSHVSGDNNGQVGDAKRNNFIFDDEEEEK